MRFLDQNLQLKNGEQLKRRTTMNEILWIYGTLNNLPLALNPTKDPDRLLHSTCHMHALHTQMTASGSISYMFALVMNGTGPLNVVVHNTKCSEYSEGAVCHVFFFLGGGGVSSANHTYQVEKIAPLNGSLSSPATFS